MDGTSRPQTDGGLVFGVPFSSLTHSVAQARLAQHPQVQRLEQSRCWPVSGLRWRVALAAHVPKFGHHASTGLAECLALGRVPVLPSYGCLQSVSLTRAWVIPTCAFSHATLAKTQPGSSSPSSILRPITSIWSCKLFLSAFLRILLKLVRSGKL
jgi:hypothetical protein